MVQFIAVWAVLASWRSASAAKEECSIGREWSECAPPVEVTCATKDDPLPTMCTPRCACPDGQVEHKDRCILEKECPICTGGKAWSECPVTCTTKDEALPTVCTPRCACPDGQVEHEDRCIPDKKCPVPVNCVACPAGYFDGCNECRCNKDGSASCTEKFCASRRRPFCEAPPPVVSDEEKQRRAADTAKIESRREGVTATFSNAVKSAIAECKDTANKRQCEARTQRKKVLAAGGNVVEVVKMRDAASKTDLLEAMDTCVQPSLTGTARKEAMKMCRDATKANLATTLGTDDINDAEFERIRTEALTERTLNLAQACDKTMRGACIEKIKEEMCKTSEKDCSSIADHEAVSVLKEGARRHAHDNFEVCVVEFSSEADVFGRCKAVAAAGLRGADLEGAEPTMREVDKALASAALSKGAIFLEECANTPNADGCGAATKKESYSKWQGLAIADVTEGDFAKFENQARRAGGSERFLRCVQTAGQASSTSSACDFTTIFQELGETIPEDSAAATKKKNVLGRKIADWLHKSAFAVCKEAGDFSDCMQAEMEKTKDATEELYKGVPADKREAVIERDRGQAIAENLGEVGLFEGKDKMLELRSKIGGDLVTESLGSMVRKAASNVLKGIVDCMPQDEADEAVVKDAMKQCAMQLQAQVKTAVTALAEGEAGDEMPDEQDLPQMMRRVESDALAEVLVGCLQAEAAEGEVDAETVPAGCNLRALYERVSGVFGDDEAWRQALKKAQQLAKFILNGIPTVIRPLAHKILVDITTEEGACSKDTMAELQVFLEMKGRALMVTKKFGSVLRMGCRVVHGVSRYICELVQSDENGEVVTDSEDKSTSEETDVASDELQDAMPAANERLPADRRLRSARQLTGVILTSAGATQATETCGVGDETCGMDEVTDGEGSTSTSAAAVPRGSVETTKSPSSCAKRFASAALFLAAVAID